MLLWWSSSEPVSSGEPIATRSSGESVSTRSSGGPVSTWSTSEPVWHDLQVIQYRHDPQGASIDPIYIYIYIYICKIQSVSEDSGCGLFICRIYEEYHINLRVLDVLLLLHHLFLCRDITEFTFRAYIEQLDENSNLIKLSKSSDETKSIIKFPAEINLLWQLNQVWVSY